VRYPTLLFLALVLTGCASKQFKTATALSGEATIIGCLTYDKNAGQYVLTDRNGEKTFVVSEGPDLKLQASGNQTVRVIGIRDILTESKTVKAVQINHIAGFCATPF
jgi:hypothetical protein